MKKAISTLILLVIIPITLLGIFTYITLNWVYSSGERAGYVQKFALKGYVCKTWEGELILVSMPGTQAEKFNFTVRDHRVAERVNNSLGQRVKIIYEEHKGIPSNCFGDSAYFVRDIVILEKN